MKRRDSARLTGSTFGAMLIKQQVRRIKSTQRGTFTLAGTNTSATGTITSVDVNNAIVRYLAFTGTGTQTWLATPIDVLNVFFNITLTNATTLTATRIGNTDYGTFTFSYEVVEYYPGFLRSVTYTSIAIANGTTSNTATVAVNDITKCDLSYLGASNGGNSSSSVRQTFSKVVLTNTTTVTADVNTNPGSTGNVTQVCLTEWWS